MDLTHPVVVGRMPVCNNVPWVIFSDILNLELRMANICRSQTGMYAGRLIGRIDRHAMFCSLLCVIEVLFSCSNYYKLCYMY